MKSHGDQHSGLIVPIRSWRLAGLVAMACIAGSVSVLSAQSASSSKPAAPGKTGKPKSGKPAPAADAAAPQGPLANNGLKAFGEMIPMGRRSRGVRIPSFDEGRPTSVISAGALTRVDDNRLFAEKLIIDLFGQKPQEDVRVDLRTGTYNMDHQILSSTERSRVSRSDFQIEGDGMVFDTKTSQGKMVGNVEMIIFDVKQMAKNMNMVKEEEPQPAAADQKSGDKKPKANPSDKPASPDTPGANPPGAATPNPK